MKPWRGLGVILLAGILAGEGFANGKGPEVLNIDHKISISAGGITLGRLLQLWDQATGMKSTVPAELENQKVTVSFAGLGLTDALRTIFEGQPFGYMVINNQVI